MTRVVVSLGSNQERRENFAIAHHGLLQRYSDCRFSPVYESPAAGFEGPDFYNAAAVFHTDESVQIVRQFLHGLERESGRVRAREKFADRSMDLDLLLFGAHDYHEQGLDVPRKELLVAPYVLKPVADLMPDAKHPQGMRTYAQLWLSMAAKSGRLERVELKGFAGD